MGRFISVKEAGKQLRVKPRTIRAWIRDLKETDPGAYTTHILTHPHPYNQNQDIYELNEDFLKELQTRQRTHSRTHFEEEKQGRENTPGKEAVNPGMFTQMFNTLSRDLEAQRDTLNRELEGQRETLNRMLQDHAKERERADTIIMSLKGDITELNNRLFLLTEGKKEQTEPPEDTGQEKPKQETPESPDKPEEQKPEECQFTFGDRLWLFKEDVKRILNKKIF